MSPVASFRAAPWRLQSAANRRGIPAAERPPPNSTPRRVQDSTENEQRAKQNQDHSRLLNSSLSRTTEPEMWGFVPVINAGRRGPYRGKHYTMRLKDELGGPHVALIGHTGKELVRGPRGSSALLGDVDPLVTITGALIKTATVTKANDAPEGPLFSFKSDIYEFGQDEDGDPITVNVVSSESVDASQSATHREPKLTANQKALFSMLYAAGSAGLTLVDWNNQAREAGIGVKRKADLNDIRAALPSLERACPKLRRPLACAE